MDVRVINVQSGTIQATEGATWAEGFGKYMDGDQAYDACQFWGGSWRLPTERINLKLMNTWDAGYSVAVHVQYLNKNETHHYLFLKPL